MVFPNHVGGPVSAIKAEWRRREFLEFVHSGGNLDCAVEMLLVLSQAKTRAEMSGGYLFWNYRSELFKTLAFLCQQELVRLQKQKRGGEAIYKAVPNAVDDLAYRVEHDGEPLPLPDHDPLAAKREQALKKLQKALEAGGWRGGKGTARKARLRVLA